MEGLILGFGFAQWNQIGVSGAWIRSFLEVPNKILWDTCVECQERLLGLKQFPSAQLDALFHVMKGVSEIKQIDVGI